MGPIMGVGLGIGINDFLLIKRGLKNLLIATVISILTSSVYFWVTPLHEAQSELLARTAPTLWDVFVAFIGGLAGIVAGTRKEKTNVIPGVAIATALMPPLCTAGFGLATGNYYYFLGAIYLYFINSLFICISTFLIVKYLNFQKVSFDNLKREKMLTRYILILVVVTVLPSIFLAYRIVAKSIFENNARKFILEEFHFPKTQLVFKNFKFSGTGKKEIDILLLGEELSGSKVDSLKEIMDKYHLKHTNLIIRQGLDAKQEIDLSQIKASILEEVYSKNDSSERHVGTNSLGEEFKQDLHTLFPELLSYSVSQNIVWNLDTLKSDTLTLVLAQTAQSISVRERKRLENWLRQKLKADSLKLIIE